MEYNVDSIIDNIFIPRKSSHKDNKDYLINICDDVLINTRFFLKDINLPNIIFFHGNAEIAEDYNELSKIYNNCNFNFIVAEYRGYGLSSGFPSFATFHKDCLGVFDGIFKKLINGNYKGKLILMGRSLGSAAVCHLASKRIDSIEGCIIESGFATEDFFFELIGVKYNNVDTFGNLDSIKSYDKPLLIIHSLDDHIVPYNQAELLYRSSRSKNKKLYSINNANHNNIILIEKENYFKKIKSFYESIL